MIQLDDGKDQIDNYRGLFRNNLNSDKTILGPK